MKYIRSMIVAFSLYSKVPMPVFEWREEDLKHNLVFLPWVGALIGVIVYGISFLFDEMQIPLIFVTAIYSLVPLVITGGFHMDGFMDVQDALKSSFKGRKTDYTERSAYRRFCSYSATDLLSGMGSGHFSGGGVQ